MLGVLADHRVDLVAVLFDAEHELLRVLVGRDREVAEQRRAARGCVARTRTRGRALVLVPLDETTPILLAAALRPGERYSPERVSTFTRSPTFTNSGTCTTSPVSSVAGLRAPETRSPWMPGSVSVTVELDRGREVDADDLVLVHRQDGGVAFLQVVDGVADRALAATCSWSYVSLSMKT